MACRNRLALCDTIRANGMSLQHDRSRPPESTPWHIVKIYRCSPRSRQENPGGGHALNCVGESHTIAFAVIHSMYDQALHQETPSEGPCERCQGFDVTGETDTAVGPVEAPHDVC